MKTVKLLTLALSLVLLSCSDNDDKEPTQQIVTPQPTASINGTWHLVNVNGGFGGTSDDFPVGMITWEFNQAQQTVTVVNNNTDPQAQDILPSGTYDYDFVANEATPEICNTNIKIGNTNLGCYSIGSQTFVMSQIEADGFEIRLHR
ncbi:hypothetical protein [Flavobacterium sp.]|uniref:hypothetical protein n=1 Tax=Flavobacterium sp. TaxID=239 RepID=UPI0039E473CD